MKNYGEKYYVGLDLGTSSVGWALTDENYNIRRAKGKDTWGVRLFDEAKTSAERRGYRTSRRRLSREKARIGLLKELFADEINKVDPGFYHRLEESKLHREDRSEDNNQKYALFTGEYTDADYYKEYPTIFHLRKSLIENDKAPYDVRLVFLALLNMYKHRGNFLNSSLDDNSSAVDFNDAWSEFVTTAELFSISFSMDVGKDIQNLLGEKGVSKSIIAENIYSFLELAKGNKTQRALVDLMAGKTVKLITIYGEEVIDSDHKTMSICFRDSNYDEKETEIRDYLGDEYFGLIEATKVVHDLGLLANIMKGKKYLTFARVESYENHKNDLEQLKRVVKKYDTSKEHVYSNLFRKMIAGNYSAYVGSVDSYDNKIRRNEGKGRKQEDLYKTIKTILSKFPQDDSDVIDILERISNETFLPKQLTSANGVIPNQVYVSEMKAILKNAEEYLPFLKEKDESGLTVSERVIELFRFRVPYYVGPLGRNGEDGSDKNTWSVRKETGRILPWNFEDKVDTKASAEKFINRMVRKCTYLSDKTTLPKNSLLYEKFMVLNEINNLRVNGEKISVNDKKEIYNTLFLKGKKVSIKNIQEYFVKKGDVEPNEDDFLSGVDTEEGLKTSLSSYGKFKSVLGEEIESYDNTVMVESIIFWITVYGDDKRFVKEKIEEEYPGKLSEEQLKKILSFKFSEWGNLSREFLELTENGVSDGLSIIQAMWETNENLMELLSDNHGYKKALESKINNEEKKLAEWAIEDFDGMYVSAPVKRMIWQTMKIMNELTEVTGHKPDRIFVEMARTEEEKKRTISRKKSLLDLYGKLKTEEKLWKKDIEGKEESTFRSKKLYLYYKQLGRCMYTGERIDLDTLLNDNTAYDIDHIYPRHFVKDDSIENNLVLVKKDVNADKSDRYPLDEAIRNGRRSFWKGLKDEGFISAEKYNRLVRVEPFTEEEKAAFINRQLVETRQGTKVITQIMKQAFPEAEIVFSKAKVVSDFRDKYDFYKARSLNDLHHAKDAYLNVVVGNAYYVKFTSNPLNFVRQSLKNANDKTYKYNMDKIFEYDIVRGDEVGWIGTKDGSSSTLNTVIRTMKRNTVLITKRAYVAHGGFSDATISKAEIAKKNPIAYMPVQSSSRVLDVSKYGGKTSISIQCYCLVSYIDNGKEILSLEALPVFLGDISNLSDDIIERYIEKNLQEDNKSEISNVCLKYKNIRFNSLVKVDGHLYNLGGKTGAQIYVKNAIPLCLDKYQFYIKKMEKAINSNNYYEKTKQGEVILSIEKNIELYDELLIKIQSIYSNRKSSIINALTSGKECFDELGIEDQCYVLTQILLWLGLNSLGVDLQKIGGTSKMGLCRMSKKIRNYSEFILINQSCTGLYSTTVDLLTL